MPGPTQNSNPADLDRVLKEIALLNQRVSALTKLVLDVQKRIPDIAHPRIAVAERQRQPNSIQGIAKGATAHE